MDYQNFCISDALIWFRWALCGCEGEMLCWEAHPQPVHDGHRPGQTQGSDECRHQGRHPDELQARRWAMVSQDPIEEHHGHWVGYSYFLNWIFWMLSAGMTPTMTPCTSPSLLEPWWPASTSPWPGSSPPPTSTTHQTLSWTTPWSPPWWRPWGNIGMLTVVCRRGSSCTGMLQYS